MTPQEPKVYEIDSFEKLCNVINRENFESLTTDLVLWLGYHVAYVEQVRKDLPNTKDKSNWDLAKSSFIWTNDGKHDLTGVKVKNQLTGEVREFKFNKP